MLSKPHNNVDSIEENENLKEKVPWLTVNKTVKQIKSNNKNQQKFIHSQSYSFPSADKYDLLNNYILFSEQCDFKSNIE